MRVTRLLLMTAVVSMLHAPASQAAPIGSLKQHRLPTADSAPRYITRGSDGNLWFTESSEFLPPPSAESRPPAT